MRSLRSLVVKLWLKFFSLRLNVENSKNNDIQRQLDYRNRVYLEVFQLPHTLLCLVKVGRNVLHGTSAARRSRTAQGVRLSTRR